MKKKQSSWIPAGLFTIVTTIATIYTLLEYRDSILIVGITSLLLLLSAFWLFTCISRQNKQERTPSVGQEQRERMNYEGMKLQGEELIRLVNTLGKGTYVYSKRSAEQLQELLTASLQMQQNTEQLLNSLIQNQTKAAKYQVKYGQESTAKLIGAYADNSKRLNSTIGDCIAAIQDITPQSAVSDTGVADKLTDLTAELVRLNSSIQALQLQLSNTPVQPAIPPVQPQMSHAPATTSIPAMQEQKHSSESDLDEMLAQALAREQEEDEQLEQVSDQLEELLAEEPVAEPEPVVTMEEPVTEPEPELTVTAEKPSVEPAPVIPLSDNPNKQLSPDEIAALFSALG